NDDECDDHHIRPFLKTRVERLYERNARKRGPDNRSNGSGPHHDPEYLITHGAGSILENGRRRICIVDRQSHSDNTEGRGKKGEPDDRSQSEAGESASSHFGKRPYAG